MEEVKEEKLENMIEIEVTVDKPSKEEVVNVWRIDTG